MRVFIIGRRRGALKYDNLTAVCYVHLNQPGHIPVHSSIVSNISIGTTMILDQSIAFLPTPFSFSFSAGLFDIPVLRLQICSLRHYQYSPPHVFFATQHDKSIPHIASINQSISTPVSPHTGIPIHRSRPTVLKLVCRL